MKAHLLNFLIRLYGKNTFISWEEIAKMNKEINKLKGQEWDYYYKISEAFSK